MSLFIHYTKRSLYKYTLAEDFYIQLGPEFCLNEGVYTRWITLQTDGHLTIRRGYSWDGPSGPTIDTKTNIRPSLPHDALYQLFREGHLPISLRKYADQLFRNMCVEDGMSWFRAWYYYWGVRLRGKSRADPTKHWLCAP